LNPDQPLNAFGLDSLMSLDLKNQLEVDLKITIPVAVFLKGASLNELVDLALAELTSVRDGDGRSAEPLDIQKIPRTGELALSFSQQRLWLLEQLEPGNTAYNIPTAVRLKGALNTTAVEYAFNEIIRRHESLRSNFLLQDGRAVQVVSPEFKLELPMVDLREMPPEQRDSEAMRLATEEARRPFDLTSDRLLRALVIRLSEQEHIVVVTMHHIVSDGWSMGVFVAEMRTLYDAFINGKSSSLPELPFQYVDFAHWHREWLQGDVLDAQLAYWKQRLSDSPPALELPTDRPRSPIQTFSGAREYLRLPQSLSRALGELSRQEGCTLFMTLLAAFKVLLHQYTQQDDISVGSFIANRNKPGTEGLIGFFVNNLVLRTKLSGNPTFREFMARVRETTVGAYQNQDLPFEKILDSLQIERDLSRTPLFQVVFSFPNAPVPSMELPGLDGERLRVDTARANFDMTVTMIETPDGLAVSRNTTPTYLTYRRFSDS
jgi:hypothetical protein